MTDQVSFVDASVKHPPAEQDARAKLLQDCSTGLFKIVTDTSISGPGTGWMGPDGRIVTSLGAIMNANELYAERDGKRYKLGKSIKIDDINNLAVLEFVDKVPDVPRFALATKPPRIGESVSSPSIAHGNAVVKAGTISGIMEQSRYRRANGGPLKLELDADPAVLEDAMTFSRRPLLESTVCHFGNFAGAPLVSNGEVLGILTMTNGTSSYAIPAEKISRLLDLHEQDGKFKIETGYENGFQMFWNNLQRCPESAASDLVRVGHGAWAVVGMATKVKQARIAGAGLAGLYCGMITYEDYCGFAGQTNERDRNKFAMSLASDAVTTGGVALFVAGLRCSPLRSAGLGIAVAGMVGRLACELVPNHFVIKEFSRKDGSSRPPFAKY